MSSYAMYVQSYVTSAYVSAAVPLDHQRMYSAYVCVCMYVCTWSKYDTQKAYVYVCMYCIVSLCTMYNVRSTYVCINVMGPVTVWLCML